MKISYNNGRKIATITIKNLSKKEANKMDKIRKFYKELPKIPNGEW